MTDVRALAIDPSALSTVYAGTSGNGVFKSTDGGTSWNAISTGLPGITVSNAIVLEALVHDPISTTTYAGMDSTGVFTTAGCVATEWCPSNTGLTASRTQALVHRSKEHQYYLCWDGFSRGVQEHGWWRQLLGYHHWGNAKRL